jgi:hypothetical protein
MNRASYHYNEASEAIATLERILYNVKNTTKANREELIAVLDNAKFVFENAEDDLFCEESEG